jgi:hypothetical protein
MINVISTDENGTVCENVLFTNEKDTDTAEAYFTLKMMQLHPRVKQDEIDISLDDGWYTFEGRSVFISHPLIK